MLFLAGFAAYAWTEPASPPPGGNVPAPINVGSAAQTKQGDLTVSGALRVDGNLLDKLGRVIYNAATGKIDKAVLPFEKGDITSDVDTNTYDSGYFDVSSLTSANIKKGIFFGRGGQVGTVEPLNPGDLAAIGIGDFFNTDQMCWQQGCQWWYYQKYKVPAPNEYDPRNILDFKITQAARCWSPAAGCTTYVDLPLSFAWSCASGWSLGYSYYGLQCPIVGLGGQSAVCGSCKTYAPPALPPCYPYCGGDE